MMICCVSGVEVETERAVDELWDAASERFPTAISAMLDSFDGDPTTVKIVIGDALTGKTSSDKSNLYQHLVNAESTNTTSISRKIRVDGTIALLRTMTQLPELKQSISPLLQVIHYIRRS